MITDLTVMLYVEDVAKSAEFWLKLGLNEVLRQDLGEGHLTILLMLGHSGMGVQLYDKDFIRQTEPELVDTKPAMLFSADYIDDIYTALKDGGYQVSDIEPYGEDSYFTFIDPDGNKFTMFGEQVGREATEEDLKEFDRNIRNLIKIDFLELEKMSRPNYIFFGRRTCPWTRYMARKFPELKVPMYWVNTEGTDAEHPSRRKYNVKTVPTLIKRASNGMFVKFNPKTDSFENFVS
ncbi:MAG: VOC family protein [Streptococcaceae bacterium]|jgi:catechol 2,3-dioxygenase-like lactoylglutathione lyase family enzyme|nr:VOC family protein [Streptococcaceae bacterium]